MPHELPKLPYDYTSLKGISEDTVKFHHDKHHKSYIDGRNAAEAKIEEMRRKNDFTGIRTWKEAESFNQSGQVLHNIYWANMGGPGGRPSGDLLQAIDKDFGSFDTFMGEFKATCTASGRAGWAILLYDCTDGKLHIGLTDYHNLWSWWNVVPLLCCDVWEHAYYYDQGPDRAKYVEAFFQNVNWDDVTKRLTAAKKCRDALKTTKDASF